VQLWGTIDKKNNLNEYIAKVPIFTKVQLPLKSHSNIPKTLQKYYSTAMIAENNLLYLLEKISLHEMQYQASHPLANSPE
jgi:hypothetical protein